MSKSNHPFLLFVFTTFLLSMSCGEIGFSTTHETEEVLVEGQPVPIDLPINVLPPLPLRFDLQQELRERDADGASAVFLEDLRLQITDTAIGRDDTDDFDFINEITIFVESRREGSNLPRRQIARLENVPVGAQEVVFNVEGDVDLKPYAEEGMRLVSEGEGTTPPDDTSLRAVATLFVELI